MCIRNGNGYNFRFSRQQYSLAVSCGFPQHSVLTATGGWICGWETRRGKADGNLSFQCQMEASGWWVPTVDKSKFPIYRGSLFFFFLEEFIVCFNLSLILKNIAWNRTQNFFRRSKTWELKDQVSHFSLYFGIRVTEVRKWIIWGPFSTHSSLAQNRWALSIQAGLWRSL